MPMLAFFLLNFEIVLLVLLALRGFLRRSGFSRLEWFAKYSLLGCFGLALIIELLFALAGVSRDFLFQFSLMLFLALGLVDILFGKRKSRVRN